MTFVFPSNMLNVLKTIFSDDKKKQETHGGQLMVCLVFFARMSQNNRPLV
jgi:hypothetical protein